MTNLRFEGLGYVPVVVGCIISADDENVLRNMGVAVACTPKDDVLDAIMRDMVRVIARALERGKFEPSLPQLHGRRRMSRPA